MGGIVIEDFVGLLTKKEGAEKSEDEKPITMTDAARRTLIDLWRQVREPLLTMYQRHNEAIKTVETQLAAVNHLERELIVKMEARMTETTAKSDSEEAVILDGAKDDLWDFYKFYYEAMKKLPDLKFDPIVPIWPESAEPGHGGNGDPKLGNQDFIE